ncbi:MAG TPA: hypothetical protein VK395_11630 [Gemmataceae bacterium]|nr:hypothetical protein [Gemmataceae bacterium]
MSSEHAFKCLADSAVSGDVSLAEALGQLKALGHIACAETLRFLQILQSTAANRLSQSPGNENKAVLYGLLAQIDLLAKSSGFLLPDHPLAESTATRSANEMFGNASSPKHAQDSKNGATAPEILEWARQQFSEEEILAGLREVRETGGVELRNFIQELEQIAVARE